MATTLLLFKLDLGKVITVYILRGLHHFDWLGDDLDYWLHVLPERAVAEDIFVGVIRLQILKRSRGYFVRGWGNLG